jgi:hypothetical protein
MTQGVWFCIYTKSLWIIIGKFVKYTKIWYKTIFGIAYVLFINDKLLYMNLLYFKQDKIKHGV